MLLFLGSKMVSSFSHSELYLVSCPADKGNLSQMLTSSRQFSVSFFFYLGIGRWGQNEGAECSVFTKYVVSSPLPLTLTFPLRVTL